MSTAAAPAVASDNDRLSRDCPRLPRDCCVEGRGLRQHFRGRLQVGEGDARRKRRPTSSEGREGRPCCQSVGCLRRRGQRRELGQVGCGACCRRTSRIGTCHRGAVRSGEQPAGELIRVIIRSVLDEDQRVVHGVGARRVGGLGTSVGLLLRGQRRPTTRSGGRGLGDSPGGRSRPRWRRGRA